MTPHHEADTAQALVHYFGIGRHPHLRSLHLQRDLGLEPLDLVLFVLELEESEGPPFDFAALDSASYVGDLIDLVCQWRLTRDLQLAAEDAELADWVA